MRGLRKRIGEVNEKEEVNKREEECRK